MMTEQVQDKEKLKEKALQRANAFFRTHKPFLKVLPNIPYVVKLSKDWYITPEEDKENWVMRTESAPIKDEDTGEDTTTNSTIFRILQLSPDLSDGYLQQLALSKNAFEIFEPLLSEASHKNPDKDLIISFTKKQLGTKYQIKWEFKIQHSAE